MVEDPCLVVERDVPNQRAQASIGSPCVVVKQAVPDPTARFLIDKIVRLILYQKKAHSRPSAGALEDAHMTEKQLAKLGINADLTLVDADIGAEGAAGRADAP